MLRLARPGAQEKMKSMSKPCVITRIMGGLGNQMFQYAAGRALALRLGAELKLDLSWYDSVAEGATPRSFTLDAFPHIYAATATEQEIECLTPAPRGFLDRLLRRPRRQAASYIVEPHFQYWKGIERLSTPVYIIGYWQSERYFKAAEVRIRQDFIFPPLPAEMETLAAIICKSPGAVSVHVRRGDYVSSPIANDVLGPCSAEYYQKAIESLVSCLGKSVHLFIFSDEPHWVQKNFITQGIPSTVISFPGHVDKPWHDMHLMSMCSHHVIANSSFSWWGAWLSQAKGAVYAPQKWFRNTSMECSDLLPEKWITL